MKFFVSLLGGLLPFVVFAQVQIDQSINPIIGQSIANVSFYMDLEAADKFINASDNLAKQTWNLRSLHLEFEEERDTLMYLNSEETPYPNYFPEANIAMTWGDKSNYDYFLFNEKGYEMLGSVEIAEEDSMVNIQSYENSEIRLSYPFTYKDSFSTVFDAHSNCLRTVNGKLHKKITHRVGISEIFGLGQGKLILPYRTFENVVAVAVKSRAIDSTFFVNKVSRKKSCNTTIFWFSPDNKVPLLTMWFDYANNEAIGQYSIVLSEDILKNTQSYPFQMYVYPNPGSTNVTIDYTLSEPQNTHIYVNNLLGQRVKEVLSESQPEGRYQQLMDATDLTEGLYFICVEAGAKVETIKWLKR